MDYSSGLENLFQDGYELLKDKRVGLVTNHTGLTRNLESNIDLFFNHPDINLVRLFAPEHGVRGNIQAGVKVSNSVDKYTGLPVYSLYGKQKKPTPEILTELDILIYDIQDIGVRFYTYVSTLFYCLESCAENDITFMVLDRLNPIGRKVEGNLVQAGFESFVGLYPIPLRHGMTVGELANWANTECKVGAKLEIIKQKGWSGEYFDRMNLLWIPPAPNIPHFETALVYPITCLFEGTNISEGRGTANPFEYIGAPWIDPYQLIKHSEDTRPGIRLRPVYFTPTFSKHKGIECGGIQVLIEDRDKINSFLTGLSLLKTCIDLYPDRFTWIKSGAEEDKYFFDLLMGTDRVRLELMNGKQPLDIISGWEEERLEFISNRKKYLLY